MYLLVRVKPGSGVALIKITGFGSGSEVRVNADPNGFRFLVFLVGFGLADMFTFELYNPNGKYGYHHLR